MGLQAVRKLAINLITRVSEIRLHDMETDDGRSD